MPSASVTSAGWKTDPRPSSPATSAPPEPGRSTTATFAPRPAMAAAAARPMPDAPPTTTAVAPLIFTRNATLLCCLLCRGEAPSGRAGHVLADADKAAVDPDVAARDETRLIRGEEG